MAHLFSPARRYKIIIKNKKLPPAGGPATINGRDDDSDFEEEHFINDLSSEVIIIIIITRPKPAFNRAFLHIGWVHLGVYSTSRFTTLAL